MLFRSDKVYSNDEQSDTDFLFNLETHNTFLSREKILDLASELNLAGVVFGRSDYSGSLGLPPSEIESERVTGDILEVARNCSERSLDLVVGGAVNINSIENLKKIREIHLTRFETRKIVFDGESVFNENIEDGLFNAVQFELKWLLNKKQYYSSISNEDNKRFDTLKARWGLVED